MKKWSIKYLRFWLAFRLRKFYRISKLIEPSYPGILNPYLLTRYKARTRYPENYMLSSGKTYREFRTQIVDEMVKLNRETLEKWKRLIPPDDNDR